MSRKAKDVVEAVASATTRRGFLGGLTRTAGTAAAAIAGVLATRSAGAGAGHGNGPHKVRWCCEYWVGWGLYETHCTNKRVCPDEWGGGVLSAAWETNDCENCF